MPEVWYYKEIRDLQKTIRDLGKENEQLQKELEEEQRKRQQAEEELKHIAERRTCSISFFPAIHSRVLG
jgi:predicted RNase H-like nuclease (RuvC/YqgF family)